MTDLMQSAMFMAAVQHNQGGHWNWGKITVCGLVED
jgi:hypothetical protein